MRSSNCRWLEGCLVGLLVVQAGTAAGQADTRGTEFFERKIRPVLVAHCYRCHSAEAVRNKKLRGGLLLDTRDGIRKGGDTGPAVVPGNTDKSLLIQALKHDGLKMPSENKRLPDAVIADFETWVKTGATDPRDGKAVAASIDVQKGRSYWAFQPPRRHPAPQVRAADWPRRQLDHFVLAAQERRGIKPNRAARRAELIRRATFDLIGLPPTPEEVEAFEKDPSPDAFARVVDRLLASPHYGERWGRYWLDLARYTDDLGGTVSPVLSPYSFRYRDWVIRAYNGDMPYDQFVRLQLAGDLLPEPANDWFERLAGLGFQGLGQQFSGNAVGMVKKKVADELDDRVDTVTRTLLGLTVSCARCHDHKFDPIPIRDYYSLAAAYNGADWNFEHELASPQDLERFRKWQADVAGLRAKLQQIPADEARRIGRVELARMDAYLLAAWKVNTLSRQKRGVNLADVARRDKLVPIFLARWVGVLSASQPLPLLTDWHSEAEKATRSAATDGELVVPRPLRERAEAVKVQVADALAQLHVSERGAREKGEAKELSRAQETLLKALLLNDGAPFKPTAKEAEALLTGALRQQHDAHVKELNRLMKTAPAAPEKAPGVRGGGKAMQVNIRGNPEQLGELAPPGFLQVLQPAVTARDKGFTRLDLADAIASRNNPLTARVWVNRVWHYHFGRGVVGTLGNFGRLGEQPTHPELLDTLAVGFMESGWSNKWLHREIVLSSTYQLASTHDTENAARDADNHYLWRFAPRRLDFEAWRDAMLAVSGQLDRRLGGPSGTLSGKTITAELHPENPLNTRRTLYSFISRFKPNSTLTLFDFPEPNVTSERRNVTTIPQQQLFALNSPFTLSVARAFAARVAGEEKGDQARIQRAWRLAFGRLPADREMALSLEFLRTAGNSAEKLTPWEQLCHAIVATNEFAFVN